MNKQDLRSPKYYKDLASKANYVSRSGKPLKKFLQEILNFDSGQFSNENKFALVDLDVLLTFLVHF